MRNKNKHFYERKKERDSSKKSLIDKFERKIFEKGRNKMSIDYMIL